MDIRILREYVEFSKHLNFSAAARFLHMSQSSLSKHIAELEKEIGFTLVNRDSEIALTAAGRQFLKSAEDMLYDYDLALKKCRRISQEKAMRIVVQDPMIDFTIGNQAIPVFMHLSEYHPNIDVQLHTISGQTITDASSTARSMSGTSWRMVPSKRSSRSARPWASRLYRLGRGDSPRG